MRDLLSAFITQAASGQLTVVCPPLPKVWATRGDGHFHLGVELFLQARGHTDFRFPQGQQRLSAMQALVMPPRLLHDERVASGVDGPFSNAVIYADHQAVSCHLAFEESAGRPGIRHLEACRNLEAGRIQGWLADAARPPAQDTHGLWPAQQRALVLTVLTAVWRLLDAPQNSAAPEPALLAKLRVLIQNQLGDADLTVSQLAQQLGCTADYLSHLYSQTHGEHLRGHIQRQRLARAARLLGDSASPVKEVAWCCGFASASYFIRSFRQHFGLTPKDFRATAVRPDPAHAPPAPLLHANTH
jgi:AraC-like DNA-binding protein